MQTTKYFALFIWKSQDNFVPLQKPLKLMSFSLLQTSKDKDRFSAFGQTFFSARCNTFQRALK